MTAYDIIKRPIITEQSMADAEMKRYTFEVAKSANKIEIAKAVEQIFGVKVAKVNTLNMQGKLKRMGARPAGRRPSWKKAMVVTPAVDQTIVKSARNIPGVVTTPASILSVYDILNAKYLVVDKDALAKIEEVYA